MQFLLGLLLLATSAGELSPDGKTVTVYHRGAGESEILEAGLEALESSGELRRLASLERRALAERLLDVPAEGSNPVLLDRATLREQAVQRIAAKDAVTRVRMAVTDSDTGQAKSMVRALRRMGVKRVRRGTTKRAEIQVSKDSETRLSPHPIFEYRRGFATVTVYGVLPDGASVVSVAEADRKALGAMRAVQLAEKEATELALHALLFDIAARKDRESLAAW